MPLRTPLRIGGRIALERGSDAVWFTFPESWHDIGRFHRADGTLTGIYANVLTPCLFEPGSSPEAGEEWHTTDLFLDLGIPVEGGVWVGHEGRNAVLLDLEELEDAEARGWVTPKLAERARMEGARLLQGARRGAWPPPVVREWTRERAVRALAGH
jgi:predicted RNA-binding protein associated with RNAse of E/G family